MYKVIDITNQQVRFIGTRQECMKYMQAHWDRFQRMYYVPD